MTDQPPPGSFPPPPPPGFPPPPPGSYAAPPPPGYATYGAAPVRLELAGFWARLGALLIDGIITGLLFVPAVIAVAAGPTHITTCSVDESGQITIGGELNSLCETPTGGTWAVGALLGVMALVLAVLYHVLLVGRNGQTWGRKALGVRVVDATSGAPIGVGRALGRSLFAGFISGSFCYLGYLWMLWDGKKQTWHDKVVSSVVVKA